MLGSCAAWEKLPRADKFNLGYNLGVHALDAYTTMEGMDRGAVELNPILGKHPSDGTIIISKVAIAAAITAIYLKWPNKKTRYLVAGQSLFGTAAVVNNFKVLSELNE